MQGVSVDYLVHLAYAYKHSLLPEHYYKSRAVLMARSGSTIASGVTTLCAVSPLTFAAILPLSIFGTIFTVVALASLACAIGLFNVILMIAGPGVSLPHEDVIESRLTGSFLSQDASKCGTDTVSTCTPADTFRIEMGILQRKKPIHTWGLAKTAMPGNVRV